MLFKLTTITAALAAVGALAAPTNGDTELHRRDCNGQADHLVLAIGVNVGVTYLSLGGDPQSIDNGPTQRLIPFDTVHTTTRFQMRTFAPSDEQGPDDAPIMRTTGRKDCSITAPNGLPQGLCGSTVELAPDGKVSAGWEGVEVKCVDI